MVLSPRPGLDSGSGESSAERSASSSARTIPIQGSLADWPLAELVQFLHRTRQTGELALERGEPAQAASLSVDQGRVVDAHCPPLTGDEAVYALFGWHHGRFLFLAGPVSPTRTLQAELRTLLLEGARRRDELDRVLAQLPPGGTALHQVHESSTSGVLLSRLAWNLLTHVDGTHSVDDLVESKAGSQIELAEALLDLIQAGLVRTDADTAFLAAIGVRRLINPTGAAGMLDDILARTDAPTTLADLVTDLGCTEEEVVRSAAALVDAQWLEVCAGHEAYLRHLHYAISPRIS